MSYIDNKKPFDSVTPKWILVILIILISSIIIGYNKIPRIQYGKVAY